MNEISGLWLVVNNLSLVDWHLAYLFWKLRALLCHTLQIHKSEILFILWLILSIDTGSHPNVIFWFFQLAERGKEIQLIRFLPWSWEKLELDEIFLREHLLGLKMLKWLPLLHHLLLQEDQKDLERNSLLNNLI